jgi:hypothetical protein
MILLAERMETAGSISEAECNERVTKRRGMKRRTADNAWDEGEETADKGGYQETADKR